MTVANEARRHLVLAAIDQASRRLGPDAVDTLAVANALGVLAPDLRNTKRERLMTGLRQDGLISYRWVPIRIPTFGGSRASRTVTWYLTPKGQAALAGGRPG